MTRNGAAALRRLALRGLVGLLRYESCLRPFIHGAPADSGALWDSFKGRMSEDVLRSLRRVIAYTDPLALLLYPYAT